MSHMNRSQSGVSSSLLSTKDMFSGELSSNTNKTGVGVLFQLDADGRVIVKTIVGGGAADRTRGTGYQPLPLLLLLHFRRAPCAAQSHTRIVSSSLQGRTKFESETSSRASIRVMWSESPWLC
jgi:hypothetical protein